MTSRGLQHSRRVRLGVLLLLLAALPPSSRAVAAPDDFGGYDAVATGTAVKLAPSLPSAFPYLDEPVEATLSLGHATLSSGGTAFARASTIWPGTVLSGLGPLLSTASGQPVPIPPYPLVVESREYDGARHSDTPGLTMATDGKPDGSSAKADFAGVILPTIFDFGAARTVSTTSAEGSEVVATSTSSVKNVDLNAGAVKIGSVVSTAVAASDATAARCEGNLAVEGLEIGGVPARIDASGIHANGETVVPGQDPNAQIASTLAATGITLRVASGLGTCSGNAASWSSGGLVVELPTPAAGSVPPGHLILVLAATAASASAAPGFTGDDGPDDFVPGDTGGLDPGVPVLGDVVTRSPGPITGGGVLSPVGRRDGSADSSTTALDALPAADYSWDGVPLSLVFALVLAGALVAHRVRRYMQRLYSLSVPATKEPVP